MKHTPIPGAREDRRTGQYAATLDGKDVGPKSFDKDRALEIARQAADAAANALCMAVHPNDPNTYCTREAGHPGDHCRAQFGTQTPSGHGYNNVWWPNQSPQEQPSPAKHTPGPLTVHGCALYEADNWKDGNNLACKLPVAITYDPEADREPSETEIANAQEIARRWNAFCAARPRAVCFHDDQPQPQAEPAPAPRRWTVQADPEYAHDPSAHPYHLNRYIVEGPTPMTDDDFIYDPHTRIICKMTDCTDQAKLARLIAAAPQLLEALELAQATINRLHRHAPGSATGTIDVIRAAIAAATGE